MVGRKRRSNASGGRGSNNGITVAKGSSSIYREMLAEAGVEGSASRDSTNGEPPLKRRRPGRPEVSQELQGGSEPIAAAQESSSEDDGVEFLDVPLPPAQVQTIERDSEDDSEEDEEDVILEDINFPTAPETSGNTASSAAEPEAQELELNLTAQKAANMPTKGSTDRRKPITKEERERRLNIHKMHLLCLLSHVARRNHWCNDAEVQDTLRVHVNDKTADYLTPGSHLPQFGQAESLKTGLKQAADVWRAKFEVTERGLRRARWAEDAAQLEHYQLPDHLETCTDRQDFRYAARTLQGSRDVGAQLYCALLRSVGVKARLVCSLQPLAFGNGAPTLPKLALSKTPTKTQRAEESRAQVAQYKEMAAAATATTSPTGSSARRRLGHPNAASRNFEPKLSPSPKKPQKSFAAPVRLKESAYPVYWVEVLDTGHQKWQPADPVVTHTFWKPTILEPPITDRENCMSYVVAFDEDGTARDVTVRYAKAYAAKTRRIRVDGTDDTEWWRSAMRAFKRRRRTDLDQIEDSELAGVEAREPMPRNVQDFKDHPVFALLRHLRRHEVLAPTAMPSGTVSSGNKGPLEKIYRRRDVRVARSADKWFRMGREVRPNEIPAKWLPKIKRTRPRNDRFDDDRRAEEDAQDAAGVPIYTKDQTELYEAAPVRNGKVPRNKFGNIEVYVPSMIPRGGTHIRHDLAAHAAKLMGVDYAPALTGFEFKGRQGTAVLKGVVVAEEYGAAMEAVLAGLEDAEQQREEELKALAALKLWRRLLMGLRIRERIWSGVDEAERRAAEEEADRVLEEADAADGDRGQQEEEDEDAGESDVTEEFDMVVDGDDAEDYGGGFLVD
ncbi:nitrilase [Cordyceps javanica]|uniref:Nitrilase n=1 Tax=Cordyceps javanica TaxID=43265 RepID=A0A545W544_9HYPO|nr:nitrilase [Cordyceps javanica]TQW09090.1 nitrilase [Cordyceps javanica]